VKARQFLELQERQALASMRRTAEHLVHDLKESSMVAQTARRNPLGTLAGALALGLLAGLAARPLGRGARASLGLLGPVAGLGLRLMMRRGLGR
jgi:hypothetical protein